MSTEDGLSLDDLFGLGNQICDWADPFGKLFVRNPRHGRRIRADLGHLRTREGVGRSPQTSSSGLDGGTRELAGTSRRARCGAPDCT